MIMRFLLGSITSALLAFVPYSAISAISVWVFGRYDQKFSALDAWLLTTQIAGMLMVVALIGFSLSFPLLYRFTHDQTIWRYLITITVPVVVIYLIALTGVGESVLYFLNPQSSISVVLVFVVTYMLAMLCAIGIAEFRANSKKTPE